MRPGVFFASATISWTEVTGSLFVLTRSTRAKRPVSEIGLKSL